MASDEGRKVTLKSSDGVEFLVEENVAMESQTIRHMIEDGCADSGIPLRNVNSKMLSKVIEYCKKHVESVVASGGEKAAEEDLKAWDSDFMKVDRATLSDLILAANYLNIKGLLELTSKTIAEMFEGETPEVIRKPSKIKQDFNLNPEEEWEIEEEIRRENMIQRQNLIWRENLIRRVFDERRQIQRENQWEIDVEMQRGNQWEFDVEMQRENHLTFEEEIPLMENELAPEVEISPRLRRLLNCWYICGGLISIVLLIVWLAIAADDL